MLGKIVMLHGVPMEEGFRVDYGIERRNCFGVYDLVFAKLNFEACYPEKSLTERKIYIRGGYEVIDERDGFKTIDIYGDDDYILKKCQRFNEEYLFVIIPWAQNIVTNLKRIAGRYYYEAIYEMHAGDTIEVSKSSSGPREVYMAVQAGNEMFLIKKNR